MKRIVFLPIAFTLLITGCAPRLAGPPPLIPRQVLFAGPAKKDPQISPDRKHLAYLGRDNRNILQIWSRSLSGQDNKQLTAETARGIQHYTWAYDNEHVIFARENNGDENWQIHTVDIGSGAARNLTPYNGVRSMLVPVRRPVLLALAARGSATARRGDESRARGRARACRCVRPLRPKVFLFPRASLRR